MQSTMRANGLRPTVSRRTACVVQASSSKRPQQALQQQLGQAGAALAAAATLLVAAPAFADLNKFEYNGTCVCGHQRACAGILVGNGCGSSARILSVRPLVSHMCQQACCHHHRQPCGT